MALRSDLGIDRPPLPKKGDRIKIAEVENFIIGTSFLYVTDNINKN